MYCVCMKKTFAVRLNDEERAALETLALGAKKRASDIIRLAIENLVLETKMNGGRLMIRKETPAGQKFMAEEVLSNLRDLYPHGVPDEFNPADKRLSLWEKASPKKPAAVAAAPGGVSTPVSACKPLPNRRRKK